jgi:hypothetical protein
VGTAFLTIALILLAVVGMRMFYVRFQQTEVSLPNEAALAAEAPTPTPTAIPAIMPVFTFDGLANRHGIYRLALLHTTIPSRPRTEIITYTVQTDDTIFGIAEMFGLKPETILWGNYYTLTDDLQAPPQWTQYHAVDDPHWWKGRLNKYAWMGVNRNNHQLAATTLSHPVYPIISERCVLRRAGLRHVGAAISL